MPMDANINVNIDKVNIGDKFSTETKLLDYLGYPKASGNSRLSFLKDAFDENRERLLLYFDEKSELPSGDKHNSLYDAKVIKELYERIIND